MTSKYISENNLALVGGRAADLAESHKLVCGWGGGVGGTIIQSLEGREKKLFS